MIKYITRNAEETHKIAKSLAKKIIASPLPEDLALVFALKGDLGSGKTTFMQGFAAGLGIKEKITSPTFNIFKKYPIKNEPGSYEPGSFYHFDCYRIEKPKEILDLGFEKIISDPKNIVAIEWAENIKESLPKNTRWINFKFVDKNTRVIDIS